PARVVWVVEFLPLACAAEAIVKPVDLLDAVAEDAPDGVLGPARPEGDQGVEGGRQIPPASGPLAGADRPVLEVLFPGVVQPFAVPPECRGLHRASSVARKASIRRQASATDAAGGGADRYGLAGSRKPLSQCG